MRAPALVVLATLILSVARSSPAGAVTECGPPDPNGVQRCSVGIPSVQLVAPPAEVVQHASEWCWAASIATVFRYYGHPVAQERIVREIEGRLVNHTIEPRQLVAALNRDWTDDDGHTFRVRSDARSTNAGSASSDLADGEPLIIGALGHAMVMTEMTFERDGAGHGRVLEVTVRDPWPTSPRRRSLTRREWHAIEVLVRIRVSAA